MATSLRRGTLVLAASIVIAGVLPARAQTPPPQDAGAAAYRALCAGCHADPAALRAAAAGATAEQRRAALDRLLRRHHARDADQRAAVIDWLERTRQGTP